MEKKYLNCFLFFIIFLFIASCKPDYSNKKSYEVKAGETFNIYFSTNSCCYYCLREQDKIRHIQFSETKTVDPGPGDCDGCNYTAAYIFKAITPGTDTIKLSNPTATQNCDSSDVKEIYIVTVLP